MEQMPDEKLPAGAPALFGGAECRILDMPSKSCLRLVWPDQEQLPPLFSQDICQIRTAEAIVWCRAETAERYQSGNRCIVELIMKSGLYQIHNHGTAFRKIKEEASFSQQPAQPTFCEALLKIEGEVGLTVRVMAISTESACLQIPKEHALEERMTVGEAEKAVLTVAGLTLGGNLYMLLETGEEPVFWMLFEELHINTRRRLAEDLVFA